MKCIKCGQVLPHEAASFCPHCGAAQSRQFKACHRCDVTADMDEVFCGQCGHLLEIVTIKGDTLMTIPKAMKFIGEPLVGLPKAYGTLTIYDNRIEYVPEDGSSITGSLGKWGKKLSQTLAQEMDTFVLSQVANAKRIFFAGVKPMLVLELTGAKASVLTFGGFQNEAMVDKAISIINTYKRY